MRLLMACGMALLLVGQAWSAEVPEWPQLRGPGGTGVADGAGLPDRWSTTENVLWKVDVPGRGWSSPIVVGDKVFLTTVVNEGAEEEARKGLYFGGERGKPPESVHQWKVLCLDVNTGKTLWERTAQEAVPEFGIHIKNSRASETPVTDGQRVYAYFGNLGVFCYDLDGELLWSKLFTPLKTRFSWGTAASPALHEGKLFIVNDNEEQSYLLCLDALTGDELWKIDRDEKTNWATPFVWRNELRTELIVPGTGKFRAYDLDGNLLYEFGGASSITIAMPYAQHGLLYVSSGYVMDKKKPLFAVRPGASGDISLAEGETANEYIAWSQPQGAPYNPTSLVYGDRLYVLLDRGLFACYDAHTGELIYDKQRLPDGRAFTSTPWAYDGNIFCLNEYGQTFVIKAGDEFEILHVNSFTEDDMGMATPAVAGNKLLIRTGPRLYCLQQGASVATDVAAGAESAPE